MNELMEMRTSERGALKTCAQKWYWSTVEGLAPKRSANPLWFGSAVHEGLAEWYRKGLRRGPHPAETFSKFLEGDRSVLVTNEDEELEYMQARDLGNDMLTRYVEEYGKDERWDVIATERKFQVILRRPAQKVFGHDLPEIKRWLRYVGTWDGVYRDRETGEIWLMEHKTAAGIRVDHLPLDDQAGSYWAFASTILRSAGLIGPKEEIAGIMYNFLRKAPADTRPQNDRGEYTNIPKKENFITALEPFYELTGKETVAVLQELADEENITVLGDVSKSQPPAFFERFPVYRSKAERKTMIRRIQDEALFAEAYRNGYLPVTKAPSKDCVFCPFQRMCQMHEGGDLDAVEIFKETQFVVRDVYSEHVKKSSE